MSSLCGTREISKIHNSYILRTIKNAHGNTVFTEPGSLEKIKVILLPENLPAGVYVATITFGSKDVRKKIIRI